MSEQINWSRVIRMAAIPCGMLIALSIYIGDADEKARAAKVAMSPAEQALARADRATFAYAYRRNTTAESIANANMATKGEYIANTAEVMLIHPEMNDEEAARQGLLLIHEKNRQGLPLDKP